jgi:hypothetical protein
VRRGRGNAFFLFHVFYVFILVNIIYIFLLYKKKILCGQGHTLPQCASVPVERATQYKICEENHVEFTVKYYKEQHSQKHKVLWDGDVVSCSCKHFEFCGILCPKKESYVQPTITKKRKDEDQAQ